MFRTVLHAALLLVVFSNAGAVAQKVTGTPADYRPWKNGISDDPNFFPIAVWVQSPGNAERFKRAGINLYVGLWKGPNEEQLSALKKAGMPVVCAQNEIGLQSQNSDMIVAWMHGDEPDNAQPRRSGEGYGPPISPSTIVENYQRIRSRDPSRPVLLNLGQGVAFDDYVGRGVRRNHPEDYPQYIRGSDIVSFDIYPAVHDHPQVAGKLEFVARGVERLRRWSDDQKIVWNCIECSRISNTNTKPTPAQIRSEVWMSLISGSRGIIYFVHQFAPRFIEASLLDDEELLAAVTELNRQIIELAPVLNSPSLATPIAVDRTAPEVQVAVMCKRYQGSLYVFAANLSDQESTATFQLLEPGLASSLEVLEEDRMIEIGERRFEDQFDAYGVHGYRIAVDRSQAEN